MPLTIGDIVRAHSALGSIEEIVEQRRAVYRAAVAVTSSEVLAQASGIDVLDNPAVRGHLGAVLSSGTQCRSDQLLSVSELVADGCSVDIAGCDVRVASPSATLGSLDGALVRINDELRRHGVDGPLPRFLTQHCPSFAAAARLVVDGVRLAVEVTRDLTLDLLPHVALLAVLVQQGPGRLGSASVREFPGLVTFPEPGTALEVAEAVIHEGAHQKFFDLSLTRAIIGPEQYEAPPFVPSWAAPGTPRWLLEQTFAAFHAYCCLSVFHDRLGVRIGDTEHYESLLPKAAIRAAELGEWLLRQGEYIQSDGHALLTQLAGRAPDGIPAASVRSDVVIAEMDEAAYVQPCGSRTLIARRGHPADLVWVSSSQVS